MDNYTDPPQGLIVLASEQLWPNLHSLEHYGQDLRLLCIFTSKDERRSIGPAKRLAEFAKTRFPDVVVNQSEPSDANDISRVSGQIRRWISQHPNYRWIINATGGNKLMFAGTLPFVHQPAVQVIYREFSGWYKLTPCTVGGEILSQPFDISPTITDHIPIRLLLNATWEIPEGKTEAENPVTDLPLSQLFKQYFANQRDWRKAFAACKVETSLQGGLLFEQVVSSIVAQLGVRNLVVNAKRTGSAGSHQQEIDLVANHAGRVWIIDCKLRSQEEEGSTIEGITSQIRQADVTRRNLGGLDARLLMLRPNRPFSPDQRELAKAYRLDVLDADCANQLVSEIAKFFGIKPPLPTDLAQTEAIIEAALANQSHRGLGTPSRHLRNSVFDERAPDTLNVDAMLNQIMETPSQD